MSVFQNKFVVIGLAGVATFMLVRSFRPLWHRGGGPAPAPATAAPKPAPSPLPVVSPAPTQSGGAAPAASVSRPKAASTAPTAGIDFVQAGWLFNGAPRRDPFQMISPEAAKLTRLYPAASEVLALTGVWWQSGKILAVINSNVVSEGESIRGFKIQHIGLERVWLDGPSGPEEIVFDPTLSLRGISMKLGTALDDSFAGAKARLDWPYRIVNGATNDVGADPDWHRVGGTVIQKMSPGRYLVSLNESGRPSFVPKDHPVIIMNVPLSLVDGQPLTSIDCKVVGSETYEAVSGAKSTVYALDFGVPCSPPKEMVDTLKFQKTFLLEQQSAANQARLKIDLLEAEQGRDSAQYMLGRRYLFGDGVPKDEGQARHWLEQAAAQGNRDAQAALLLFANRK